MYVQRMLTGLTQIFTLYQPMEETKPHILVADDNLLYQEIIEKFLIKWGYQSSFALNGQQLLKMLEEQSFQLLITDLQMPQLDGLPAIREIRKKFTTLPIIVVTGLLKSEDKKALTSLDVHDFFPKPFAPEALRRKIQFRLNP